MCGITLSSPYSGIIIFIIKYVQIGTECPLARLLQRLPAGRRHERSARSIARIPFHGHKLQASLTDAAVAQQYGGCAPLQLLPGGAALACQGVKGSTLVFVFALQEKYQIIILFSWISVHCARYYKNKKLSISKCFHRVKNSKIYSLYVLSLNSTPDKSLCI